MLDKQLLLLSLRTLQKNEPAKTFNNSLDHFKQWVAAKSPIPQKRVQSGNVLMFRPKLLSQEFDKIHPYANKPLQLSFFAPKHNKLDLPPRANNALEQKNNQERINQKRFSLDYSCSNCNEPGHNSLSCMKESPSPKRGL